MTLLFLSVRPAGRTHLEVKVLYSPGKGKLLQSINSKSEVTILA